MPTTSTVTVPSTSVPPTTAYLPPPCQTKLLQISAVGSGAAAGNVGKTILFTNLNKIACSLSGYPGVAALDLQGNQVAQAMRQLSGMVGGLHNNATTVPVVTLAPGQVASAEVEGTDNPVGTATSCTYYPLFLVTPPGETQSVTVSVSLAGSNISGFPGCSPISVNPVVPGSTGRLD